MSLLKPTPGEVIDRISILILKIDAYKKKGRDAYAIISEQKGLVAYFKQFKVPEKSGDVIRNLTEVLGEINRKLWDCEDVVRSSFWPWTFYRAAKRIAVLNDLRSRTINDINKAFKAGTIEEKIYQV